MDQRVKLIKILSNQIDVKTQLLIGNNTITSTQLRMLHYLYHHDCKNQKHLCETFKLSSPTVNGILDRLEKNGYIIREKLVDKRNNKILLTDKALQINKTFEQAILYNNQILSKNLTDDEIQQLTYLLSKLLNNIEEGNYDKNFSS